MTEPTPPASPAPNPSPLARVVPIVGPLLTMLGTRKGLVVVGAISFATVVYFRDPAQLDKLLTFLGAVIAAYFGAQSYEDASAKKSSALVEAERVKNGG